VIYRSLGPTGIHVSEFCLGTMMFGAWGNTDAGECRRMLDAALDAGINFVDTADEYGFGTSEEMLGGLLKGRRDDVVLATKFHHQMGEGVNRQGNSRRWIMTAVEESLRRLNTDYIDLYQVHRPDPATDVDETLGALTDLVREGKVRYVGCSNVAGWQVADWDWTARTSGFERFVSVQNRYSLLDRSIEAEVVPAAERFGLGMLPYFPLEYGLLTGKYHRGQDAPYGSRARSGPSPWLENADWDRIEALTKYAEARDVSLLDVAIAGLAAQPTVACVISGATSGDQVRENAAAMRWQPTADDLTELDAITQS
jgi:aryl-alcohol dehydrogenase-like predicted oxidoreductase